MIVARLSGTGWLVMLVFVIAGAVIGALAGYGIGRGDALPIVIAAIVGALVGFIVWVSDVIPTRRSARP